MVKAISSSSLFAGIILLLFLILAPYVLADRTAGPDLDVGYIDRVPRYFRYCVEYFIGLPQLCANTSGQKMWPEVGETLNYTAHVINKGNSTADGFDYYWIINNGSYLGRHSQPLAPNETANFTFQVNWTGNVDNISFLANNLTSAINETVVFNNRLNITSNDLTISFWVEKGSYDAYNSLDSPWGSYSCEDYVQHNIQMMNLRFSQAVYPVSPNGILDRVRIDKFVVADQLDGSCTPPSLMDNDSDQYKIDGRWQFTDGSCTNEYGNNASDSRGWVKSANYSLTHNDGIDWGLIHELAHQLGVIDLYRLGIIPDENGIQVTNVNGTLVNATNLDAVFPHSGIMAGGSTMPYNDGTYFESHIAGGLNSDYGLRRGFYGEFLYDTPEQNYVKVLDSSGNPIPNASVGLYQKGANEWIDNTPEINGTTDANGLLYLPNRPVNGTSTATGHTLRPNPFGQISVVGETGTMLVKVTKGADEDYKYLHILDLNLAYWINSSSVGYYNISTVLSDNYPPVLNLSSANLTFYSNQSSINLTTNEAASCRYANSSGCAFSNMSNFTITGGKVHSLSLDGLNYSSNYTYFVKCNDSNNNANSEISVSFSIMPCIESWNCSAWGACSGSSQARACTDANSCGTYNDKPGESQACSLGSIGGGGSGGGGSMPPPKKCNLTINCSAYPLECPPEGILKRLCANACNSTRWNETKACVFANNESIPHNLNNSNTSSNANASAPKGSCGGIDCSQGFACKDNKCVEKSPTVLDNLPLGLIAAGMIAIVIVLAKAFSIIHKPDSGANSSVAKYIADMRASSYPDSSIRKALLDAGWDKSVVDSAFSEAKNW